MRRQRARVRLGRIADRQWGRVSWAQIKALGVDRRVATDWKKQGYIHRVLPGVYAVGHRAPSLESDLAAALLYAGPGAALSHTTAAYWLGLLDQRPQVIHVSTPRRCRSQRGIKVHGRRDQERIWHQGLPTTALPQLFLDLAATTSLRTVRHALANADYRKALDVTAAEAALARGRPGSAKLRRALYEHQPRLARTKSRLERAFLELCETAGMPLPEVNVQVAGWEVDALFRAQGIAVELDGPSNHRSQAQVRRDRLKELALRRCGLRPVRYSDDQVFHHGAAVLADLTELYRAGTTPNSSVWP
jgi:predicted transcriptional regulator of viral defense system